MLTVAHHAKKWIVEVEVKAEGCPDHVHPICLIVRWQTLILYEPVNIVLYKVIVQLLFREQVSSVRVIILDISSLVVHILNLFADPQKYTLSFCAEANSGVGWIYPVQGWQIDTGPMVVVGRQNG